MTGPLPQWLARWAGVDAAKVGEGTVWTVAHHWPWAPWVTLVLICAGVGWVVACYLRERGTASRIGRLALAGIRLVILGLVVFMLAGVELALTRTGLPFVALVLDLSASMSHVDRHDESQTGKATAPLAPGVAQPNRWDLARELLLADNARLLKELDRRYRLRVYRADVAAQPIPGRGPELAAALADLTSDGAASRLGLAVRSVLSDLRGTPPSAIILMSDGINTEGESLAEASAQARRKGVPLFTIGVGSEEPLRDVRLADLLVDEVVFADDVVNFEGTLSATGLAGKRVEMRLTDEAQPSVVLARTTVELGREGEQQRARIPYRPTSVGDFKYKVEVEPLPEETQSDNNQQSRLVSVRKEQIRVLFVQSRPSFEFRYLKHMLQRDTTIQLHTVLQEADLEYAEQDETALRVLPVREDDLLAYDVILFGDLNPAFLSAAFQEQLYRFVAEKGGGLVVVAGPEYTPWAFRQTRLAQLLPVELDEGTPPDLSQSYLEPFRAEPTEAGLAMAGLQLGDSEVETRDIWKQMAPMYWYVETPKVKPAARVLATHSAHTVPGGNFPLFVLQYVGAGKVLYHGTDETWRWRYRVGDVLFSRYWVQTIRFLSRSKLLGKDRAAVVTTDRNEYLQGEPVQVRVRFTDERRAPAEDDGVRIVMERAGQPRQTLALRRDPNKHGIFETRLSELGVGQFHLLLASPALEGEPPAADFLITAPPGETQRLQMDLVALTRAAEDTRGRFYRLADAGRLLGDLPPGREIPIEALPPIKLWNRWPVIATLVFLLALEWILRKRMGML